MSTQADQLERVIVAGKAHVRMIEAADALRETESRIIAA